jgi:hypothetical protein
LRITNVPLSSEFFCWLDGCWPEEAGGFSPALD